MNAEGEAKHQLQLFEKQEHTGLHIPSLNVSERLTSNSKSKDLGI